MRFYLAGPMRGIKDFNVPMFKRAEDKLASWGHIVFNPAAKECEKEASKGQDSLDFRRRVFDLDTHWICNQADAIALLPGWENSLGATAEKALADAIGLHVYYLFEDLLGYLRLVDSLPGSFNEQAHAGAGATTKARAEAALAAAEPGAWTCATSDAGATQTKAPVPMQRPRLSGRLLERLTSEQRKEYPVATGFLDYFPDAIAEVSHVSWLGNQKHNPGQELHWSREKSADHADCAARHMTTRGGMDGKVSHLTEAAWRIFAELQIALEKKYNLSLPPGATTNVK